jgi:hypothetical protein
VWHGPTAREARFGSLGYADQRGRDGHDFGEDTDRLRRVTDRLAKRFDARLAPAYEQQANKQRAVIDLPLVVIDLLEADGLVSE